MMPKPQDFEPILLTAIDDALLSLGESIRTSIYYHLEKNFKVTRDAIPANLPHFQTALEKIFGLGARFLEILIMKNLYAKINCPLVMESNEELEFVKYVEAAKQTFIKGC
jgi:hypothetical protein